MAVWVSPGVGEGVGSVPPPEHGSLWATTPSLTVMVPLPNA